MRDLESRRAAAAFWTLLGTVAITVLATVGGNLAPAVFSLDTCDTLGLGALALALVAHALPLATCLRRLARPSLPIRLAAERI